MTASDPFLGVALSLQYVAQPFIWRNWPPDESFFGWLHVVRHCLVNALVLALAVVQLPSADIQANHTCSSVLQCTIREATRRSTHVQDHSTCEMQTEPQNCGFQLQSAATDRKWLLRHLQQFFG